MNDMASLSDSARSTVWFCGLFWFPASLARTLLVEIPQAEVYPSSSIFRRACLARVRQTKKPQAKIFSSGPEGWDGLGRP